MDLDQRLNDFLVTLKEGSDNFISRKSQNTYLALSISTTAAIRPSVTLASLKQEKKLIDCFPFDSDLEIGKDESLHAYVSFKKFNYRYTYVAASLCKQNRNLCEIKSNAKREKGNSPIGKIDDRINLKIVEQKPRPP